MRSIPSNLKKFQTFSSQSANFPHKIAKKIFFLNFPLIPLHFFTSFSFSVYNLKKFSCRIKKNFVQWPCVMFLNPAFVLHFFSSSSLRRKVRENFFHTFVQVRSLSDVKEEVSVKNSVVLIFFCFHSCWWCKRKIANLKKNEFVAWEKKNSKSAMKWDKERKKMGKRWTDCVNIEKLWKCLVGFRAILVI